MVLESSYTRMRHQRLTGPNRVTRGSDCPALETVLVQTTPRPRNPEAGARWIRTTCVAVLVSFAGEVARAQFAASVQAVEVYATVTRGDGLAVPNLVQSDFEILEDGVRQPISVFAAGEFPLRPGKSRRPVGCHRPSRNRAQPPPATDPGIDRACPPRRTRRGRRALRRGYGGAAGT